MNNYPYISLKDAVEALEQVGVDHEVVVPAGTDSVGVEIYGCASDSRHAAESNLFICKGAAFKADFLAQAVAKGASAYLCDRAHVDACAQAAPGVPHIVTDDVRAAMEVLAPLCWGHPDRDLNIVGMTGTKGKSTATWMLRCVLDARGIGKCGYIGSIETYDGIEEFESVNTTPEAPDLWRHLANCKASGIKDVIVEVSSQALKYGRVAGVHFTIGCFLNIGLDHISPAEHSDYEDYISSKLRIFDASERAVVNLATKDADRVLRNALDSDCELTTFGNGCCERGEATVSATDVQPRPTGLSFMSVTPWYGELPVELSMGGMFNVDNALAAIACAGLLGVQPEAVRDGLLSCSVPGRMQTVASPDGKLVCIVDYAHNELSFETFFASLRTQWPEAFVVSYFGAGGGKAFDRRRDLPRIASLSSQIIILTSDDPGPEPAESICHEMSAYIEGGIEYHIITDRECATDTAFRIALERRSAHPDETVVVCALGKGNETLMHIGDEFLPYEDDWSRINRLMRENGFA